MLERVKSIPVLFWLVVIVPTAIAVVYYALLAEDIYVSEARIVVRNPSQPAATPLTAALSQSGFGSVQDGNDTVVEYLRSRQSIAQTNTDGLLTQTYSAPHLFFADRFGAIGGKSEEEFFEYFAEKMTVEEGATTQVLTITVRAFDPKAAQEINQRMVAQAETLVNSLSERARTDSITVAQEEYEAATQEARAAAMALATFRDRNGIVDPAQQSEVGLLMISKLQDELISAQTQLRQLQTYTPRASQIPFLKTQIKGLREEIVKTRRELTGGRASLSSAMAKYSELQLNSQLADKQLAVMLASLQEARGEARRKRAYLEQVASPSLPDYPTHPRRIRSIIAALVMGLLAWGVLTMLMIGVREHRD